MLNALKNYLSSKNIKYNESEENKDIISFVYLDHYYIFVYEKQDDPNYVRLCLPNVEAKDVIDETVKEKMYKINNEYKIAKATEINEQVWLSAESFVFNYSNVNQLFERMIYLLHNAVTEYHSLK